MRTAARASLVLLALVLPFEPRQPIAHIGPLALTLVELALYAAIALGGAVIVADVARRGVQISWRGAARRHAVAIAWLLALALSAAAADVARADAVKFALRAAGGLALYVVAAAMLRQSTTAVALLVAGAVVAGATIAALAMCAEIHVAGAAAALVRFHSLTFQVLGLPRASGPFQYPNIAAMYVEATLPLAIAVGAAFDARRRADGHARAIAGSVAGATVAVLLTYALSLTAARAALVTAGVVLAVTATYALWRRAPSRWPAVTALAATAVLAAATTAGPLGSLRLQFWKDAVWYRSQIVPVAPIPAAVATGSTTTLDVDVANSGARVWPALGENPVALSYHWLDPATGRVVVFKGERTALPRDVPPGDAVRLSARVVAPDEPGHYRLRIQMVHERITWFDEQGDTGHQAVVDVLPRGAPAPPGAARAPEVAVPPPQVNVSRTVLWRAALMAWRDHPLTGLGPDNFRRAYGHYVGLANPDPRLHANNTYLETLASLGLVGAGALALTIVWFWRAGRRALRAHDAGSPPGLLAAGASAALAAYLVHGFVDYFLEFTPTYALLWLLGGMLAGLGGDERHDPPRHPT